MRDGVHGSDHRDVEAAARSRESLSDRERRRHAAYALLSGNPSGRPQTSGAQEGSSSSFSHSDSGNAVNVSKQTWADISEEDGDNDVTSSPWFSSSTGAEGGVPGERPRKLKIKNKKLLFERGPAGSEGSAPPMVRPSAESSSSDFAASALGSLGGTHKVWSSGNSTSSDMDSGSNAAASSSQMCVGKFGPPDISAEELAEMMQRVPLDEDGQPTSLGSIHHAADTCRPCVFQRSKLGCHSGVQCQFCHLPHKRKSKQRPCKGKRDRHKKLIERVQHMMGSEGEASPRAAPPESSSLRIQL